jgi:predicted outer membrane repeat protein
MGMRLTTIHGLRATRVWRPVAALLVAVALVAMLGVTSVSATSATACRVQNTDTGKSFTALQPAVDAAKRGDRLTVRGTCRGRTIIDRSIVIVGVPEADPKRSPTLSGGDDARVIVVRKALKVRIEGLRIQGPEDACVRGSQGIRNLGNLTLRDVEIRRLHSAITNGGRLRLVGSASVEDNCKNAVVNYGVMVMNGVSRISRTCPGCGPVIPFGGMLFNTGSLTMNDDSRISHNGSVLLNGGTITMNGSSLISRNGPVVNNPGGVLTLNDSASIRAGHLPDVECGGGPSPLVGLYCPMRSGAGVLNMGSLTLNDGATIRDNSAGGRGGGVAMYRGTSSPSPTFTMTGSMAMIGNTAGQGGVIYAASGTTLVGVICGPGGNVYGNTPDDCYVEP